MSVNTIPPYVKVGVVGWNTVNILTGNTSVVPAGTVGTDLGDLYTVGADGEFIERITVMPKGTNVATVIRIFINNGSSVAVATNNTLLGEIQCPATTVSQIAAQVRLGLDIHQAFPAGYKFYYTIGTTVAAGFSIMLWGGSYSDV